MRVDCVMVGPSSDAKGGIASVISCYQDAGLFESGRVVNLASTAVGGVRVRLMAALTAWFRYICILTSGNAPVLHVHVASRGSFWRKAVFIWTAKLARRKVVFHLHGGGFQSFIETLGRPARAAALATIRQSDRLLCLSSPVACWLRSVAPQVSVKWWPNPVPDIIFNVTREDARVEPIVLYLGALTPAKGVDDLLSAFVQLKGKHPDAKLIVGGAGAQAAHLRHLTTRLGLDENVSFPGWIDSDAKVDCLRRARVLVLPSRLEAQPMVILEAMAAMVPVISTAVGGIPDLITDGGNGLLVPVSEPDSLARALLRLWNDDNFRMQICREARYRLISRHKASNVCASLMELYRDLMSEAAGGRK